MDISAEFQIGSRLYEIHPQIFSSWMLSIVLWIVLIIAGQKARNADPEAAPTGLVLFLEILVNMTEATVTQTMGLRNLDFAPFVGAMALYLAGANLFGLIGLAAPTSDINVTLALACFAMWMMIRTGCKFHGLGGTLRNMFFGEFPWLFPLEVVSQLARPISLAFRLFGVILSGELLLQLIKNALRWASPLVVPFLQIYFDLFEGLIQVMIFVMLAMVWTSMLTETIHHEKTN